MTPSGQPQRSVIQDGCILSSSINQHLSNLPPVDQSKVSNTWKIRIPAGHHSRRSEVVQCKLGGYNFLHIAGVALQKHSWMRLLSVSIWKILKTNFGSLDCRQIQMIHFLHYQVHLIYCLSNWSSAKSLFKKKKMCPFPGWSMFIWPWNLYCGLSFMRKVGKFKVLQRWEKHPRHHLEHFPECISSAEY